MDGAMGKEKEVVEAVLTCEGDFHDPELLSHLEKFRLQLTDLLLADEDELNVKKVEPWNSVKVTLTIPREAALRLRQLAQSGNEALRHMGVLSVQLQGDSSISLKIVGRNNETTEFMLHTPRTVPSSAPVEAGVNSSTTNAISSPGPSNEEVTRKNIVDYLIQGPPNLRPNAIFNSVLGANSSTAPPFLGANRVVPPSQDSFSGAGSSRPTLRPNSMASAAGQLHNPALRGSHPSSFPFSKTSGAFHIPIPHQQTSAGQSTSNFSNVQTNSFPVNNNMPGHINSMGLQNSGPQQKNTSGTMNTFGSVGSKLPGPSSVSNSLPPSPSPGFMIDLPPPPPYPHNSSSTSSGKPGKQGSASSPLLVNLLQTDPIAVAAGMASANSSKTVNTVTTSAAPPPKKKKRPKKPKETVSNSFSSLEDLHNKDVLGPNSVGVFSGDTARIPESSVQFSSSKMQKDFFLGSVHTAHAFSNVQRSESDSKSVSDKSFKPVISSDRPFIENSMKSSAFSLSKFNTSVGSAIGTDHMRFSETNVPRELSQELIDSFSKEIAAGKIINPYTGQLETRDNLSNKNSGRLKEDMISSRVISNRAREIGNSNFSNVPVSVSQMMDINVLRSLSTGPSSTAALFHSGGSSLHLTGDKHSQLPPHRRNFSDNSVSTNKNIYAAKFNSKSDNEPFITSIPSTLSPSSFNPHHQVSASSIQNQLKGSYPSSSGPSSSHAKTQQGRPVLNQHVLNTLPPHSVPTSLLSSGVSESVINSKLGSSCSTTTMPAVTNKDTFVKHLEHNPSLFQLTSCANSNTQTSVPHHSQSFKMFSSSSSQSVVQTRPVLSQAQSSFHSSERLIPSDISKSISSSQHVQAAASSDSISSSGTKQNFPHLLNSLPEKQMDQQGSIQSPLEKVSPEGDDNSNHSGLVSENLPEVSGTSVLLEHTGVKAENHDSGVGSSSERSDDTPSEPGDGEFRANNGCPESDEANKSTKRLVNHKADVGSEASSANTITVGYMMSSIDSVSHLKSSQTKEKPEDIKTTTVSLATHSSNLKTNNFFDTQVNSLDKNTELPLNHPLSTSDWMRKDSQVQPATYSGKMRLNGPLHAEKDEGLKLLKKEFQNDTKLNGPSAKEMDEMLLTIAGLHGKGEQMSPKHNSALKRHSLHLQHEVLEEMAKFQQLAASKDLANAQGKLDKDDLSESMHRSLNSEDRHDQLPPFFDMEDLVNGKLFGNGSSNVDCKTGSNITSIYSKRSSPVNVNMLNHIYAPGLPLPRRLTESVQRLVKPLPASESSMPQMRLCKSPGMGTPRAATSTNGPSASRMAFYNSGTRSPGSSIPKLVPSDKHSLLSGGLDLAGLSSKFSPNSIPLSDLSSENASSDSSNRMLGLMADFLSRDGQSHGFLSSSCHISPPLLTDDSLSHSQKMLSQSYPPHKSRDLSNNMSLHDLFSHIQQPGESLSDSNIHSLSSSDPALSSNQQSQSSVQHSRHNTPNSMLQSSDSYPVSTFTHSSAHTHASSTDILATSAESALSKSAKTTPCGSSLSSPNHSRPASPTVLANSNRMESSSLSKTDSLTFKAGVSAPWAKISLNNGSKSSSNQKIAISPSQKNVPYVTLSSSSVAGGSAMHSAQSVSSRITPVVCSALLSGSVAGNPPNSLIDNLAVLKSNKPDTSLSPRALNKSDFSSTRPSPIVSSLGRNLFESVSCDLPTIPHSVVQTSRNKTFDTLVSHSSSISVLDLNHAPDLNNQSSKGQRRKSDSISPPQLSYHSDINPSQSIRTNETPSTSLPAQVVHLDFPHLPPTVSDPSISKSVPDHHVVPVSPKVVKSPVLSSSSKTVHHNWNSTLTNPTASVTSFPVISSSVSKMDPSPHTTTVSPQAGALDKKTHTSSPTLVKEPILETLASALKKVNEEQSRENKSLSAPTSLKKDDEKDSSSVKEIIIPEASKKPTKDVDDVLPPASETNISVADRIARKRGSHVMEEGEKEGDGPSAAKRLMLEVKSASNTNVKCDESDVDKDKRTSMSSSSDSLNSKKEQKKEDKLVISGLGESNNECVDKAKDAMSTYVQSSVLEIKKNVEAPKSDIKVSESDMVKDKSIPILSTKSVSLDNASSKSNKTVIEQKITTVADKHTAESHSKDSDSKSKVIENSKDMTVINVPKQHKQHSLQGVANREDSISKDKDQNEKQSVKVDGSKDMHEKKSNPLIEDTQVQKHVGDVAAQDSTIAALVNEESKLEDGAKKGHRMKRQFYAYVPEKSIDQTYFETTILTGRTRSRNKPEPTHQENAAIQEGSTPTTGTSDPHTTTVAATAKTDSSDAADNKRSTRSLRTKDTSSQDLNASKRRRLQTRDHR